MWSILNNVLPITRWWGLKYQKGMFYRGTNQVKRTRCFVLTIPSSYKYVYMFWGGKFLLTRRWCNSYGKMRVLNCVGVMLNSLSQWKYRCNIFHAFEMVGSWDIYKGQYSKSFMQVLLHCLYTTLVYKFIGKNTWIYVVGIHMYMVWRLAPSLYDGLYMGRVWDIKPPFYLRECETLLHKSRYISGWKYQFLC